MLPKIIDNQNMWRMYECRVSFGNCGRSFIFPVIYKSVSDKKIVISGSMFWALSHFCSVSTDTVHLSCFPLWVHFYRCCIISGVTPKRGQRLVVVCPRRCRIVIVGRVSLIHFMMKCAMWMVVISRDFFNYVRSISSHSTAWVRFLLSQC